MACRTIEGHLDEVVSLLIILQGESVEREAAGRRAGVDCSAMRTMSTATSRIGTVLGASGMAFGAAFGPGGPPGAFRRPFDELLGVKTDG